jgi:tRNA dimethylallyltransferase
LDEFRKGSGPAHQVYFVVGPTAVGKSRWALGEALRTEGVMVNADSVQFYRGFDIGTAKPTLKERSLVPHFLYDVSDPDEPITAADFRERALAVIAESVRKRPVYVVGGSGFYLQALEKGIHEAPPLTAQTLARLSEERDRYGLQYLHDRLTELDPKVARKISANDSYRLQRNLGLIYQTGQTVTAIREEFRKKAFEFPFPLKKIGFRLNRSELRVRVQQRVLKMLEDGWIEEVEGLLTKGYGSSKAMQSIGYKEVYGYLQGDMDRDELNERIVTSTMQLAKRQMTWFRRDVEIDWIHGQ